MDVIEREIAGEIERIRQIYCWDVLRNRSRTVQLPGRKCDPRILETFLGYEVQAGKKRITCPDAVSARYLKIFVELGFKDVQIPYDPTRTALIVTGLEGALSRIKELLHHRHTERSGRQAALRRTYRKIRIVCRCPEGTAAEVPS